MVRCVDLHLFTTLLYTLMGVFHYVRFVGNCIFQESEVMFTQSVRISCSFLVLSHWKYKKCLIFHLPSPTRDPYQGSTHLLSVLPCVSTACLTPCLYLYCNCLVWKHLPACRGSVPEHHFTTRHRHKPTVLERTLAYHKHLQPD